MHMIKKIAFTASMLLFVLAQLFSFYVITASHKEKIELIREKEGKSFEETVRKFSRQVREIDEDASGKDYLVTHCFRQNMKENSALYKGEEELFNSSPYTFHVAKTDWEKEEYPTASTMDAI